MLRIVGERESVHAKYVQRYGKCSARHIYVNIKIAPIGGLTTLANDLM